LDTLHPAAVAIRRKLFDTHNPAAVVELEHAVRGTDTTADHATPSPPLALKSGDDGPTAWY
jgi:hypothetical protein